MKLSLRILSAVAFIALGALCGAGETFPSVHHERLTVRVVNGTDGKPRAGLRVVMAGGYAERDLALGLWQEAAVTNAAGEVRVPDALTNLPFLRVWVPQTQLCQGKEKRVRFLVDRIRNDGLNSDNTCGTMTAAARRGLLTVFVRGGKPTVAETAEASAETSANATAEKAQPARTEEEQPIDPGTAAAFAAYERLLPQ
jgi:hypothetical protein